MANLQYFNVVIDHDENYFLTSNPSLMARVEREEEFHQGVVISLIYSHGDIYLSFCPGMKTPTGHRSDPCVFKPKTIMLQEGMSRFNAKAFNAYKDLFFTDRHKAMRLAALFAVCGYSVEPLAVQYAKAPVPSVYEQLINELNINPTSAQTAEVTTPTTNMEQTENLSLSSAVIRCDTPESAAEQRIMERINTSLHNGGMCVYNCHIEGDDNEYDTPKVVKAHEALGIEEGEEFYGWEGYERITMLDFQKVTLSEQHPIGEYITLSEDTRKMMAGNRRDHFDWHKPETAMIAIRMEMPDGSWYEYVMNRTV